ncbi:class I SAM-dependent methyltransferase [Polynucleobacter paneuropaeus]|nr:class I SAM-dependent methyltransferase [Polynucleobacter paneuropaeus]
MSINEEQEIIDEYYKRYYHNVHYSRNKSIAAPSFHKALEKSRPASLNYETVIELGCGGMQHLEYVKHGFQKYIGIDRNFGLSVADENFKIHKTVESLNNSSDLVVGLEADLNLTDLSSLYGTADRVVVTCLLLHMPDAGKFLTLIKNLLKPDTGVFDLLLPVDPGLMVDLYRFFISRPQSKRLGCTTFDLVSALEHKASYKSLYTYMFWFWRGFSLRARAYPFGKILPVSFNAYIIFSLDRN